MYILDHKINKRLHPLRDKLTGLLCEHLTNYSVKVTNHRLDLCTKAVACFILNSYQRCDNKHYSFGITLQEGSYSKSLIVNGKNTKRKVSYTYTRALLDFLVLGDYTELEKGGVTEWGFVNGKWAVKDTCSSKVTLKPRMQKLYEDYGPDKLTPEQITNTIILKDKNKDIKTFKMTEEVREVKRYLDNYNKFSQLYEVSGTKGATYDVQMYKVYNENFKRGARSYMSESIQSLNQEQRKQLKIKEDEVCVFDFKGFEPCLLYSIEQEVMEVDDPYIIGLDGWDEGLIRKVCKKILLIMLNTESKGDAHRAALFYTMSELDVKDLYLKGKIPTNYIPVKQIMEALEQLHHVISHKFYMNYGGELQYVGSLINDYVVEYMMQNHKCLVLQVFDEFIAPEQYRQELRQAMVDGWGRIFGFTENCKITEEK